jgi:uncharacterized membrane-anchored protein YhcB (DUF1043 family)
MTIDEVILVNRLNELKREYVKTEICIKTAQARIEEERNRINRHNARLDMLIARIERDEQALFWARLNELLHTSCWRYRVA